MTKIVVTGVGAVTPIGNTVQQMWKAVIAGQSGIGPITHFDASEHETRIAAQVKDFAPQPYLTRKEARRLDPLIQFAVSAAGQAIEDAALSSYPDLDHSRTGVLIGAGIGGMRTMIDQQNKLLAKGPRSISPFFIPSIIANMPGAVVAQKHRFTGPSFAIAAACATGNYALGEAMEIIRRGVADVMVCGAADASIVPLGIGGFSAMRALSTTNDNPAGACRPFDRERNGFVMGEGAAVIIIETLEHARRRGARIYAELAGYGSTSDAYHLVAPEPSGRQAARSMQLALENACIMPDQVDYINAHGTGTELNDPIETRAIKAVFGEAAYRVAISSTKAVTGHLLGGASALEAIIAILSVHHDVIPPTMNLTTPDPACDLHYVPLTAQETRVRVAMSNGFGFGGHNAVTVFRELS